MNEVVEKSMLKALLWVLLLAAAFAVSHTQAPLGYSNQNQYLLHGFAMRGAENDLASDWLATTRDPTPVFSKIVAVGGSWIVSGYFFVLMAYLVILRQFVRAIAPQVSPLPVVAGLIVLHAGIVRFASDRLLGADYAWFFQCGIANQYVLGPGIQPSCIGVMIVGSIVAFVWGRFFTAIVLAAGANLVHSTYLLPSACLIAGYLATTVRDRQWSKFFLGGGLGLIVVAPVLLYNWKTFAPTNLDDFQKAQEIIAWLRIPHHTKPARWFDAISAFQIVWIACGIVALRRTVLFLPLAVTFALASAFAAMAITTQHATLSLMFPWRISAVLMPIATTTILTVLARRFMCCEPPFRIASIVLIVAATLGGIAIKHYDLGYREPSSEDAAMEYLRVHRQPGEVYLVPARFPKPTTQRGVFANTFVRPPAPDAVVFFEMQRFRLKTGAALFVDFKSIPYHEQDVLEWHRRVGLSDRWFSSNDWNEATIEEIRREGITHVVAPAKLGLKCDRLLMEHDAGAYRIYRILN